MYITPRDDVVMRCRPLLEKHIPVVSSPHCALHSTLPDWASNNVICLSVVDVAATWPAGSSMTLR